MDWEWVLCGLMRECGEAVDCGYLKLGADTSGGWGTPISWSERGYLERKADIQDGARIFQVERRYLRISPDISESNADIQD